MLLELQGQSLDSGSGVQPRVPSTPIKETCYNKKTESGDVFSMATEGRGTNKGSMTPRVLTWDLGLDRGQQVCVGSPGGGAILPTIALALVCLVRWSEK